MAEPDEVRAMWDTDLLHGLWNKAREVLESPAPPPTFRLELPDEDTRQAVGEIYGRPMWGYGTRISVSKLDANLRENTRFGLGLAEVLEILHGRPLSRSDSTADAEEHWSRPVLRSALAAQGLAATTWAEPWAQWLRQYGRIADDELDTIARRAAAVLAALMLDPARSPDVWASRADLATRFGGGAHQLDSGTALSRVVLRAASIAHDIEPPGNERDRQALWERCGVTLEAVSATALCWALPVSRTDAWSRVLDQRTSIGLPTHFTHLDLRAAPEHLVDPGTVVAVCENPRVLEAAVHEGIQHPLVCVSGHPTTVAVELLRRLTSSGAVLRYHGDFDWTGISIARTLWTHHDAALWRMGSADYRESLDRAAAERTDLPTLVGAPVDTPWDPALSELMANTGRGIDEEMLLPVLLNDLRDGLENS